MHILYIHQHFKTPAEPGGTRSYWIAQKLISGGHQVTMLASSSTYNKKIERKIVDGIHLVYIKVPYDQKMGILQRFKSFVRFMLISTKIAWDQPGVDMVVATSTPLTVGFPALILKWFKRIPYVFEVRDLWPEVPIQMRGLNNPVMQRFARWFEKTIYRNATHVIALSPGMQQGVTKHIPISRTSMIPNMAKVTEFWPRQKNFQFMESLGLSRDTFKAIHFGSLGLANGAEYIIEAADLLKERGRTDIEIIFVGGGSTEQKLKEKAKKLGLDNVKFLGAFAMKETSEIVNLCDVSVVSFLDIPILYTNSPNKLFDSLSAGKPVIVNSRGWTKDLVEKEQCGFFVDPQRPQELVDCIIQLRENPDAQQRMGANSRRLAETKYDKSILCTQFLTVVENARKNV